MSIVCGPTPVLRDWRPLPNADLTKGELVCRFAEQYLKVPEGNNVGDPLVLDDFQVEFILAVVDNPNHTRTAVLSMARRNGKTFLVAVLVLAYLIGPLAVQNSLIASAAHSRDQAALVYKFIEKMILMSDRLQLVTKLVPSAKRVLGLPKSTEYNALSADAKTGFGRSLRVIILDESGQFLGPVHPYVEMLTSSQGSYEDPLFVTISTQAASDGDWLSVIIDDAIRSQDPSTVVHLYAADKDGDLMDPAQWVKANPGLGRFRSEADLRSQLEKAQRLPGQAASAMNLLLNMRVALESLWLGPTEWKSNDKPVDLDVFRSGAPVAIGLDLSARTDLTAAVLAVKGPDDDCHLLPFGFTPLDGLEARAARDRAPYDHWVREGDLIAVPGPTIEYNWVAKWLKLKLTELDIHPEYVCFDRWRIEIFQRACADVSFAQDMEWLPVGQGYKDMSPRLESFETLMLARQLRHGGHPLLNLGAAGAIAMSDPARNRKLEKSKSTARIDVLVAAVMAAYQVTDGMMQEAFDPFAMVG